MSTLIVGGIVFAILAFAAYRTYKNRKENPCSCGCSGCGSSCKK
ncbi:FeoB-associated Cys-rich membrane protein [Synergistaceae bacterium OttesenSCG-928-D05]|nr:FeoB-associated Cys-rich membrane protein [Synergistaceae bacterium OttesenSCG-928-D05]